MISVKIVRGRVGVREFYATASRDDLRLYLSAENPLDKQIAATALIYDLVVATRNVEYVKPTGVGVLNPFLT